MSKRWVVVIILFAMGLVVGSPPSAEASLASIGYTVLRWLDRADILHHDLTARIDPPNWSATFTDDVTFQSKGSRSFHILLGKDARIDRITMSDTGEASRSPARSRSGPCLFTFTGSIFPALPARSRSRCALSGRSTHRPWN